MFLCIFGRCRGDLLALFKPSNVFRKSCYFLQIFLHCHAWPWNCTDPLHWSVWLSWAVEEKLVSVGSSRDGGGGTSTPTKPRPLKTLLKTHQPAHNVLLKTIKGRIENLPQTKPSQACIQSLLRSLLPHAKRTYHTTLSSPQRKCTKAKNLLLL